MMALKLLPIFQVIIILCSPTWAYPAPIYGTKRYGRIQRSYAPSWPSSSHPQPMQIRSQRFPVNYYDANPYNQNYPVDDYYYPQDSFNYPMYYPRTSKYEVYQAVLPYYYDTPFMGNNFGYYYDDPSEPGDDDITQENDREQREQAQPIGQEMYYEGDSLNSGENVNEVNAAFLQNLIMSQMYKDSLNKNDNNDEVYGKLDEYPPLKNDYYNEDQDVLELKQLAQPFQPKQKSNHIKNKQKQESNFYKDFYPEYKRSSVGAKKSTFVINDRKETGIVGITSTQAPSVTTVLPKKSARGQKEEVLLRPATPLKFPYPKSVLSMMQKKNRERTPSVYDTIKHMLDMEKSLEKENELKPSMRKRVVSSEDSLIHQLSILKKQ